MICIVVIFPVQMCIRDRDFDEYSIAWVKDLDSRVEFVNGFIESYGDPLGLKASWESIVNFNDLEATKRTEIISANAQWFEDHSPVDLSLIHIWSWFYDCLPAFEPTGNQRYADWYRE